MLNAAMTTIVGGGRGVIRRLSAIIYAFASEPILEVHQKFFLRRVF